MSAAVRDLTERRRLEHTEELMRVKTEFFATVSHELRTPLASILGYGELMSDDPGLPDECRKHLEVMMRGAHRELRLVDDLLTLVDIDEGGLRLRSTVVDLAQIARSCLEGMQPRADLAGVRLGLDVSHPEVRVRGDDQRVAQCLDNLLSNAIKFTPSGGTVVVRVGTDAAVAVVEVADTGPGITPEDQELVFERLYRSRSAVSRQVPGAGLGLAIALAIARSHGGGLDVVSSGESGTVLRMTLPLHS